MLYFFIFIFGLCVGSFLNVLIFRLGSDGGENVIGGYAERGQSPAKLGGRSHCPKCGHQLAWQDLVPVLSFVLLKGRCRYCQKAISWQYPIVELATGLLFLILSLSDSDRIFSLSDSITLIYFLFIASCLIVIFVSDLKYFIIPDEIIIAGVIGTFLYKLLSAFDFASLRSGNNLYPELVEGLKLLLPFALSAVIASAFFLVIVLITRGRGMGLGDAKLAFLMGLVLGWPKILPALLLAFVSGALVGLILILAGKAKMKSEIPFGTFLAANTFLIMLLGEKILIRYINLII
ncbi:MAG: prepilin peptidase [Candidatus Portnoybacteria bacterium CG_4_10_14_0_8_um_filter_40_50]|uniref:Prepilin peptidase n=1 Tax=Candidatus Portnoybacteria bacterium CG_4_10_14_0_8_um_filter_40_50 TaxID=1974800 RepID=A0A2M7QTM3_9BACT|nr:MAG: prepilin peptidase [Candidatus Portnoybacteria bacterium CG_4_10_14_0_8_um_filter_40_50]